MTPSVHATSPDIRIRAVKVWAPDHRTEAPHVTLSAADKAELRRLSEVIDYKTPGSLITLQGQPASFLYLLVDGIALASRTSNGGDRQVLAFYWPGDLFGIAEHGIYLNSTEGVTACTVYRFPTRGLDKFLMENPKIQHDFLIKAIHDLREAQRHLIVIGQLDIRRRLAAFLLNCSGHGTYFDPVGQVLTVPMTRYDIADYLGTSAESITRAFGQLEKQGLIRRLTARTLELRIAEIKALVDLN